jgi:hypothetical protein
LLSNIVLDELDQQLARRGHWFARYADDAKVYVRSERAGLRVMASLTGFIERRLRLKVNQSKSAVARPEDPTSSAFRLRVDPHTGTVDVLLSERTRRNAMERIRQLTPRNWGSSLASCITQINAWLRGWHGFFGIASPSAQYVLRAVDAHIRRRLRAIVLRHSKRKRTIARRLIKLGGKPASVWRQIYSGHKSWRAISHTPIVDHCLNRVFFRARGLMALVDMHRDAPRYVVAPETSHWRYGDDFEVANRPAAGVITRRPEEPYTTSVRTVLWVPGRATAPATRAMVGARSPGHPSRGTGGRVTRRPAARSSRPIRPRTRLGCASRAPSAVA